VALIVEYQTAAYTCDRSRIRTQRGNHSMESARENPIVVIEEQHELACHMLAPLLSGPGKPDALWQEDEAAVPPIPR
jgi:hypothetical protein